MGIDYQFLHFQQTRDEIHGNEYHFHQGSTDRLVKNFRIFIGSARTEVFHFSALVRPGPLMRELVQGPHRTTWFVDP